MSTSWISNAMGVTFPSYLTGNSFITPQISRFWPWRPIQTDSIYNIVQKPFIKAQIRFSLQFSCKLPCFSLFFRLWTPKGALGTPQSAQSEPQGPAGSQKWHKTDAVSTTNWTGQRKNLHQKVVTPGLGPKRGGGVGRRHWDIYLYR